MFARAKRDREEREARKLEREAKKAAREKATGSTATKTCKACGTAKALDDFARHGRSHDGHRHTCRSCDAAARAKRRAEISLEDLAEARERRLVGNRRAVSKWQKQNNAAVRAKSLVRDALKSGVIAKPERCQIRGCKERGRLHAHHFSYEHPLQVLFTCFGHHKRLHAGDKLELAVGLPPSLLAIPQKEDGGVMTNFSL